MHSGRMEVWKCVSDDKREAFLRNHEWGLLFHNNNVCSICHHTLHYSPQYADYGPIFRHICIYRRPRMQKYNKALYLDRHGVYTKKTYILKVKTLIQLNQSIVELNYNIRMFTPCFIIACSFSGTILLLFTFLFLIVQSDDRITHQFAACLEIASKTKGRKSILYINRQ